MCVSLVLSDQKNTKTQVKNKENSENERNERGNNDYDEDDRGMIKTIKWINTTEIINSSSVHVWINTRFLLRFQFEILT